MASFAQRLRYLVARFAHHTSLFAFELFNEVNCMHPSPTTAAYRSWHQRMAQVMKLQSLYTLYLLIHHTHHALHTAGDKAY
jgi:hypothetical protein